MNSAYINGFIIEMALLFTIGLQGAYILKQGISKKFTFTAVIVCAFCECVLVSLGILGTSAIIAKYPQTTEIIKIAGATFLVIYAIKTIYAAIKGTDLISSHGEIKEKSSGRIGVILTAVAISWLNPHVLIDTTLMGTLASKYYPYHWGFASGVFTAAFLWYFFLGIAGKTLSRFINSQKVWKCINIFICILCLYIAYTFLFHNEHDHEHEFNHEHKNEISYTEVNPAA